MLARHLAKYISGFITTRQGGRSTRFYGQTSHIDVALYIPFTFLKPSELLGLLFRGKPWEEDCPARFWDTVLYRLDDILLDGANATESPATLCFALLLSKLS